MTPPFRVGVMQLTMEPLEEMLESARVMDLEALDTRHELRHLRRLVDHAPHDIA